MTAPRRRPRGTMKDPTGFGYIVERPVKEQLDRIAIAAGVSGAVMLEHIITHLEVTDRGLPVTWPAPEPKDGELLIDTA